LTDIGDFESQLYDFQDRRTDYSAFLTKATPSQMAWIGLLFAVLGSGVQLSDLPFAERLFRKKAYGMMTRFGHKGIMLCSDALHSSMCFPRSQNGQLSASTFPRSGANTTFPGNHSSE
jgi:hypothetical protein